MVLDFIPDYGRGFSLSTGLDDAPGRNGEAPIAVHLRRYALRLAALAATVPRTIFCQNLTAADRALTATPLMRMRYNDNWAGGRLFRSRVLHLPAYAAAPGAGTTVPTFTFPGTDVLGQMVIDPQTDPNELRTIAGNEDATPVTNAYRNISVSAASAFRTVAVAIDLVPSEVSRVDTDWLVAVNPARFRAGGTVLDAALADLRAVEHLIWTTFRHVWAAWSSVQEVVGQARSVTGTTFTNLITLLTADATWNANAPGEIVSAENAGRGPQTSASGGDRLLHRCSVYADATANSGEVRFQSSLNSVTITVPTGGPAWIDADGLEIPTTQEYDNVVISGRHASDPAQTVRVWRWMIQPEP